MSTYASTVIGSHTRRTRGGRIAATGRTSRLAEQRRYETRHPNAARLYRDRCAKDEGIGPAKISRCRSKNGNGGNRAATWAGRMAVVWADADFGLRVDHRCWPETSIGVFQERGLNYRDLVERKRRNGRITREDMDEDRSEGIFYNPATCSETEIETMRAHAEKHGLRFLTLEEFLYTVFYRLYYYKRWRDGDPALTLPTLVIGHNLLFDLGALSSSAAPSIGRNYGGLTLKFAKKRPSIVIKKLGFGKHLFAAHQSWNKRRNLQFVDTMQLGRALLGPGNSSIEKMLAKLKIGDEAKGEADHEGPITDAYIEYCRGDVRATWRIFAELRTLYRKHGRTRDIDRITARPRSARPISKISESNFSCNKTRASTVG